MRVLFTPAPGASHILGVIPLANGFRAAGHDVIFATTGAVTVAARAGYHVVDVLPGADLGGIFAEHAEGYAALTARQKAGTATREEEIASAAAVFGAVGEVMAPPLCDLADRWRPDLVVYTPMLACGPLLAAHLDVPGVEQMDGFTGGTDLRGAFFGEMEAAYQRFAGGRQAERITSLDVLPASLSAGRTEGRLMRFIPYTGGDRVPTWMFEPPRRRRIVVTFGTVLPHTGQLPAMRRLIDELAAVDASVLVALGGAPVDQLGQLPDNVAAYSWLPVDRALSTCVGLVHHGGQASMLTAAASGVPQLVLPHDSDQFANGDAVRRRGIGLVGDPDAPIAEHINALLTDDRMREAAQDVQREIASMPTPAQVVASLTSEDGR